MLFAWTHWFWDYSPTLRRADMQTSTRVDLQYNLSLCLLTEKRNHDLVEHGEYEKLLAEYPGPVTVCNGSSCSFG